MATIGYLKKKHSIEIAGSPWGIQYLGRREHPHHLLQRVGELGVKWARLSVEWSDVEVEPGRYDWSLVDSLVAGLAECGVSVFFNAGCASHRAYHDFPEGYRYPPTDEPKALEAYCRYTAAAVDHFGSRIRHYEVWNEPNLAFFWRPQPDPKAYSLLVRRASAAMKAVDPDIKILGGVGGVDSAARAFVESFLSEPGTPEAIDILTYHPYNPSPDETYEDILAMRTLVDRFRPGLPMWQGECGCPSSGDTIHFRGDAPWGYNVQSKWLLRRLLTDYMAGAEVSVFFLFVDFIGNLLPGSPDLRMGYNTKGLVQHTTWQSKPAFYALQNLAAAVNSAWKPVAESVQIDVVDPGIFYGIGPHEDRFPCVPRSLPLRSDGVPMLAYWLPWRPQELIRPALVRISWPGVVWKEPVCVDLISGVVTDAPRIGKAVQVPMGDYPMLVAERSAMDLAATAQQPGYDELVSKLRWTNPRL